MRSRTSHGVDPMKVLCPKCRSSYLEPLSEREAELLPYYRMLRAGMLTKAECLAPEYEVIFVCRVCNTDRYPK